MVLGNKCIFPVQGDFFVQDKSHKPSWHFIPRGSKRGEEVQSVNEKNVIASILCRGKKDFEFSILKFLTILEQKNLNFKMIFQKFKMQNQVRIVLLLAVLSFVAQFGNCSGKQTTKLSNSQFCLYKAGYGEGCWIFKQCRAGLSCHPCV